MADGSCYEGEFQNGEITGHGFKKWSQSESTYTGSFVEYVDTLACDCSLYNYTKLH